MFSAPNQQVIGLGSWISGTNYKDVLTGGASDHDLRLVIQRSGVTPAPPPQPQPRPQPAAPPSPSPPSAVEKELFSNSNVYGVENDGRSPLLTFSSPTTVTFILTYHWNSGRGAPAGTIALKRDDGTVFGPWQVTVNSRVYWEVRPNVVIPAGRYQVIDSDPSTWAQNSGTGGFGIVRILGY